MKIKRLLRVLFLLCVATFALPWFTYNPKVMGYRWGLMFAKWYALPFVLVGGYLFAKKKREFMALLAEVSVTVNLVICLVLFGRWQELCNIAAGFRWMDGFRTAQPGFWVAAILMVTLFAVFQVEFCQWPVGGSKMDERLPTLAEEK